MTVDVLSEGVLGDVRVIESTDIARSLSFSAFCCADALSWCGSVDCSIPGYSVGYLALWQVG